MTTEQARELREIRRVLEHMARTIEALTDHLRKRGAL